MKKQPKNNHQATGTVLFGEGTGFIKSCLIDVKDISIKQTSGSSNQILGEGPGFVKSSSISTEEIVKMGRALN